MPYAYETTNNNAYNKSKSDSTNNNEYRDSHCLTPPIFAQKNSALQIIAFLQFSVKYGIRYLGMEPEKLVNFTFSI
jgi:hypothetical protein